jgi:uncharacterized RDD family membrane protein YckC
MNGSLLRRLASIVYDSLLLLAVLFFSTLIILPFTHGEAISSGNIPFTIYLLCICYLYFTWQWTHGGQTLGMLAWKIKLIDRSGNAVNWNNASLRFLLGIFSVASLGAGFIWALFDPEHLAFHDRYSNTFLVLTTDNLKGRNY